jgi:CubicO group peptidase (beta-lactamase class C family)
MRFQNYLLIIILLIIVSCTEKKETKSNNPVYSTDIENRIKNITSNLQVESGFENVYETKTLTEQLKYYHTPGLSIAVINDGKIEWARGFGIANETTGDPVNVNTLFEAGSVSKPIFALGVMRLKEQGKVDLDKDVNEYLKSWKVPANKDWQPKITLRQLLSHTAGLTIHGFPGYLKTEAIPTVPQILNGESPSNTRAVKVDIMPGTTLRYSGGGTTVAMLTIMDVLGKPFPAIMREQLFDPMQLRYSTYAQPLPDSLEKMASTAFPWKGSPIIGRYHVYPEMSAAGLWTNPSELAALLVEVQKALKGSSSIFKKETIEEMLTPQKKITNDIGIGFFLQGKGDSTRFGHNGWDEGFVAMVVAYKNLGKGAVIMVNSNEGYAIMDEILRAIAIEYQWPDFIQHPKKQVATTAEEIKNYPGIYMDTDSNELKIDAAGNNLRLIWQQQPPIVLTKTEEGKFMNDQFNFTVTFDKDGISFNQQGNVKQYKKK